MKLFKLNRNGLSILEVIIAMGIMGILSYAMIELISNQNKAVRTTQNTIDVNEIQNQVQRYLLDSEICKSTLANLNLAEGQSLPITEIKKVGPTGAANVYLTSAPPNNKFGGMQIESFLLTRRTGLANKELEFEIKMKRLEGGQNYNAVPVKRKVNLSAKFDVAPNPDRIVNCFSQLDNAVWTAVQEACLQICPTCTWDSVNNKCVRPTGSLAIYRNSVNGQLSSGPLPSRQFTQCISGGGNCGNSETAARNKCTDSGGYVTSSSCGRGGCSTGGKSYTGVANCSYNSVFLGYLNP